MSSSVPAAAAPQTAAERQRHREVLEALSGLLLGMFVTILSSTVVSTSLPRIIGDIGGGQSAYTWVVTSTLLAMTVSTPIWGKFADLFDRKLLVQLSLIIFVIGSALAGFSRSPGEMIGFRVIQGLGAGGLTALVQVVLADLVSPRERGRYAGYLSATMAVGTVGGPLLGGTITDSVGWRWNFYIGVPIAAIALIVLQKTLHLAARPKREVSIDYLGAGLIGGAVSLLLIWVSLAGTNFAWLSTQSYLMIGISILLGVAAILNEFHVREPIIPMNLFRNRTVVLAVIASVAVGTAMFGTSVFLSQYMQLSRGKSPIEAGLLTLPMVIGVLISSLVVGRIISRTGVWKRYVVTGSFLLTIGMALMSTIHYDTSFVLLYIYMAMIGLGVGVVMQNLVLVVQNSVKATNLGSASATVTFFRSLGGAIGVSALGALLGHQVSSRVTSGLAAIGAPSTGANGSHSIPVLSELPPPVRLIVEQAYGLSIGNLFLVAAILSVATIITVILLPNVELGRLTSAQQLARELQNAPAGLRTERPVNQPPAVGLPAADTKTPSVSPTVRPSGSSR